jgi:hypothetical protein
MEGDMVKNNWSSEFYNEIVKEFFQENLPYFSLIQQHSYGPYWSIEFIKDNVRIRVEGDMGFSIDVYIQDSKYSLWQYDRSVIEKMKSTEDNIQYQLNVLKQFLNEVGIEGGNYGK